MQVGLSKADQLSSNRIKPKPSMKNNNFASDEELLYFNWLFSDIRYCIVCNSSSVEYHHLKFNDSDSIHNSSAKKVHSLIVPVCTKHHTGNECSFHGNKKEMAKLFTKESLTVIANRYYEEFKNSSFCNECDDLELVFDDIM